MAVNISITGDLDVTDGIETVTYRAMSRQETYTDYAGVSAVKGSDQKSEASGRIVVSASWYVAHEELSVTPKAGDLIQQSDGTTWAVYDITVAPLSSHYTMACVKGKAEASPA